jgi:hypothetical protein
MGAALGCCIESLVAQLPRRWVIGSYRPNSAASLSRIL